MEYFKANTKKMFECADKLQRLMHEYGYTDFADAITQAAFNASDEVEEMNPAAHDAYRHLANTVCDMRANEPDFTDRDEDDYTLETVLDRNGDH